MKFRGHKIKDLNGEFFFSDSGEAVKDNWKERPCGHCGKHNTAEGHDGCLGTLPGVLNACCGHGNPAEAYIQFSNGQELRETEAVHFFNSEI